MARIAASGRTASVRSNNILYNGDFEIKPASFVAATNVQNRWVDGTAGGGLSKLAFGWGTVAVTAGAEVSFDTTVSRNGTTSLKLSTLDATGAMTASSYRQNAPTAASLFEVIVLVPSTSYTLNGFVRTSNVATNGAFIELREFNVTGGTVVTNTSNKLSGTNTSWRQVTVTFTTNVNTRFGGIFLRNNVPGNVSDAWFDDITLIPAVIGRVTP